MPSPPKGPTLLTLPLELRFQIYTHLLVLPTTPTAFDYTTALYSLYSSPTTSSLHHPSASRRDDDTPPRIYPAVLRVCRQTHAEAIPVLYRLNTFLADDMLLSAVPRLRPYYGVIKGDMVWMIRRWHIRLRLDSPPPFTPGQITRAFSGCDRITISLWQATFFGGVGAEPLRRFEGIRGVKVVVIRGAPPGFGKYVSWLESQLTSPEKTDGGCQDGYVARSEKERKRLNGWS